MRIHFLYSILHHSAWINALLFGFLPAALIAPGVQVADTKVDYAFGKVATFQAHIQADVAVKSTSILIKEQGDTDTLVEALTPDSQGIVIYHYDLATKPLRAFARVDYWFKVTTQDGKVTTSPVFSFKYEDNRFTWQTLEDHPFTVHWYEGDETFAQGVLDVAQQGIKHIQGILPLKAPSQVDIYVYASPTVLQETLLLSGRNWEAGHADPDLGVMVVALPAGPDQTLVTEERIPHELMHIMLYQANPGSYNNLPAWFNEGLASISELVPNPDYQVLLETAVKKDTLIPMVSLCQSFPLDISGAQLAYAEATAFTRYLYRQYGSTGLQTLIGGYTNGLECSRAVEVSLKTPLPQIERDWQTTILGSPTPTGPSPQVWPWFAIMGVVLAIPLILVLVGLRKRTPGELSR